MFKSTPYSVHTEPLKRMPYAQACIVYDSDGIHLISYVTHVATLKMNNDGTHTIFCYGLYSNTTRRHISAFARQHGLNYYDFKRAYENGGQLNV